MGCARGNLGQVLITPYRVRLRDGKYREPDIAFIAKGRTPGERFSEGADLVMEILSESAVDRKRDLETKRTEYAAAGIPEYWIVDPVQETITVLALEGDEYRVHGEFESGATATSILLDGFAVDVTACFAAAANVE
ncbi:MAG: Uma2 family endonuclease [Planctomycetota bacterium]|nr:MAG: Uma2 family endonuclease [Planctomycetota bacterium]REK25056.1 MAG: Uma2 family endonuclease [Planctomycetota bacterium]REK28121.1 MAG: Uma2 family endonuclease [Planctomycetota bacterium]